MPAPGGRREGAGRKKGVPNKATVEIKALAQQYGPDVIARLAELSGCAFDAEGRRIAGAENQQVQVSAMRELLDRGYGKATQPISGDPAGPPVQHTMKVRLVRPD